MLSITGQKFSKCLKNGSDRLRKGQLPRRRKLNGMDCAVERQEVVEGCLRGSKLLFTV